jgi:hypothetical protein
MLLHKITRVTCEYYSLTIIAFIEACKNGHIYVVDVLLKDSRVNPAARDNLGDFRMKFC